MASGALSFVTRWLGTPSSVKGREARWGRKGSFALTLAGSKTGAWYNHEIGKGGRGLISLYKEIHNIEWKEALKELANDCGLNLTEKNTNSFLKNKSTQNIDVKESHYRKKKIEYAQNEYKKAVPIQGTWAEKYLRETRGIFGELPSDFRFRQNAIHLNTQKPTPALIAPYRDKNNTLIGFVGIFLGHDGTRYQETFLDLTGKEVLATRKANVGLSSKGAVVIQKGAISSTLWVAEGIETALSISRAVPNQTVVASLSASQLKNVPVGLSIQKVIICADNDPATSHTKQSVIDAVAFHLSEGRRVFIAIPPDAPSRHEKCDFNDLLKQGGVASVQKALEQRVEIKNVETLKIDEPRLSAALQKIQSAEKLVVSKQSEQSRLITRMVNQEIER